MGPTHRAQCQVRSPDLVPPHAGGGGTDEGGDGGGTSTRSHNHHQPNVVKADQRLRDVPPSPSLPKPPSPHSQLVRHSPLMGENKTVATSPGENQHQTVGYKPQEIPQSREPLVLWPAMLAMFRARQGRLWQGLRTKAHWAVVWLRHFGSYSAPKHLRMDVPPKGRRHVLLRGRGHSQWCHWTF